MGKENEEIKEIKQNDLIVLKKPLKDGKFADIKVDGKDVDKYLEMGWRK